MFKGYSKNFWLLAISMLFFMMSFNLLIPELNTIMEQLGSADKKGLVFIFFSITAVISRPISGKLSDTIGRKKVMYIGVIMGIIACFAYSYISGIVYFLLLRLLHGFSAGFHPTGATAMVTDLLPPEKRGQGMGLWGVFIAIGFGAGQTLTYPVILLFGYNSMYIVATLLVTISGVLLFKVKETLPAQQITPFSFKLFRLKWIDIIEPSVRPSAVVMFLTATCSGFVFVLTPDIARYLAIDNKGVFFGFYTISTLFVRLFSSSLSDKIGRRKTLIISMGFLFTSMLMIGYATTPTLFIAAALIFGIAYGISSPTIMAWMADLSNPTRRGVGSGTLFIALEGGFMFGAGLSIVTYNNSQSTILLSFLVAAIFSVLTVIYLIWHLLKFKESNLTEKIDSNEKSNL